MYNGPVRWYTVVDEMSIDEMSVDELSWNRLGGHLGQWSLSVYMYTSKHNYGVGIALMLSRDDAVAIVKRLILGLGL